MNTRTKAILAASGVVLAGAVWVPQLVGSDATAPAVVDGAPAEGGASGTSFVVAGTRAGDADGFPGAEATPASEYEPSATPAAAGPVAGLGDPLERMRAELAGGGPSDLVASLDDTLDLTESFGSGEGLELDELIRAMREVEAERGPVRADAAGGVLDPSAGGPAGDPSGGFVVPTLPEPLQEGESLEAWAARNPITILIHGEDGASAMLGHRVVRPGDRIERGEVLISEIGPSYVLLLRGDEHHVHELPPFVALRRTTTPTDPEPAPADAPTGAAGTEDVGDASAGAPTTATESERGTPR